MGDDSPILDSIWYVVCIILGNFDFNSRQNYAKPSFFMFILYMFCFTTVFMSMFAASLIVRPQPDYVEKFEEVPKRGLMPLFSYTLPYWKQFSDAKSGPYKDVFDVCRKLGIDPCMLYQDRGAANAIRALQNPKTALFAPTNWAKLMYPLLKTFDPKKYMHVADERMRPSVYAYMYSKNISNAKRILLDEK